MLEIETRDEALEEVYVMAGFTSIIVVILLMLLTYLALKKKKRLDKAK